jgi:hypothetical protein
VILFTKACLLEGRNGVYDPIVSPLAGLDHKTFLSVTSVPGGESGFERDERKINNPMQSTQIPKHSANFGQK